ncbi:putative secreted protein [Undibacterium sp. GrIS 1.2]|uniref:hypothetical protein n=1 Tax=Undibacterium sp. GrIS 1.2 TaxID=3143933 RepID=UPI00339B06F8
MFYLTRISNQDIHHIYRIFAVTLIALSFATTTQAQISVGGVPGTSLESLMPDLLKADSVEKVLAIFKPPVSKTQLVKSDYLLLDNPAIAPAGQIPLHLMSELPGTEFFLLLNATTAKGESAVLAAQEIPNMGKADIRVTIKLAKSSELLLVVRAGGKWYSVTNDIKIATK